MMAQNSGLHIMIAAGENSGDRLGAQLMASLKHAQADIKITGLGGPDMQAQGLASLFPMDDIAVMGVGEILARLRLILRRISQMVDFVVRENPDILVLIDSPEFAHRVAKKVKKQKPDLLIIDYVAPSVWAWRQRRAKKMRNYFDHVLAILPFEPNVFKALNGPDCTYVGHPATENLAPIDTESSRAENSRVENFREKYKIENTDSLIAVLPGSRMSEVKRMLNPLHETIKRVAQDADNLQFIIPAVPHLKEFITASVTDWDVDVLVIEGADDKLGLFHAAHCAIAASGTSSFELGLVGLPMIIGYRMGAFMEFIGAHLIRTPSVVLPNLILDKPIVPEFLGTRCHADLLAPALLALINNDGKCRDRQMAAFVEMRRIMQPKNGTQSMSAALKILDLSQKA